MSLEMLQRCYRDVTFSTFSVTFLAEILFVWHAYDSTLCTTQEFVSVHNVKTKGHEAGIPAFELATSLCHTWFSLLPHLPVRMMMKAIKAKEVVSSCFFNFFLTFGLILYNGHNYLFSDQ